MDGWINYVLGNMNHETVNQSHLHQKTISTLMPRVSRFPRVPLSGRKQSLTDCLEDNVTVAQELVTGLRKVNLDF